MRSWLRRWRHPWRLIFGLLTLGAFIWLLLGVFGFLFLDIKTAVVILLGGLFAFEATI